MGSSTVFESANLAGEVGDEHEARRGPYFLEEQPDQRPSVRVDAEQLIVVVERDFSGPVDKARSGGPVGDADAPYATVLPVIDRVLPVVPVGADGIPAPERAGVSRDLDFGVEGGLVAGAESEDVDLIVLGTHGRTGLSRLLMGSVAEVVVRRAPCPVLAVPVPEGRFIRRVGAGD